MCAIVLVLALAVYLAQALYFVGVLVPVHDSVRELLVGARVVRGEISLYDDRLLGHRVPLPFYVLGATQLWIGPSLLAARYVNIAFGVAAMLLTAMLAGRLAGPSAAALASVFFASQGVVVAYYSYEGYPALAALCFMAAVVTTFGPDRAGLRFTAAAAVALLFFVRSNLWPAIPFLLAAILWRARSRRERLALVGVVVAPVLVFFAWDTRHLKLLAYVPVLRHLVAPLGYVSLVVFDDFRDRELSTQLWEAARLVRRYEFWALAGVVLGALRLWRTLTGRAVGRPTDRRVTILVALLAYMLVAQCLMFTGNWTLLSFNWRWLGLYLLPFAPLIPLLLGVEFGRLLDDTRPRSRARVAVLALVAALALPPLYWVRNPLLPTGEVLAKDPFRAAHAAAEHLRRVVPADRKVFYYGLNMIYYLSALPQTYLQQYSKPEQFARIRVEDRVLRKSGFVPISDMRDWLSRDADYAVIDTAYLDYQIQTLPSVDNAEQQMKDLLARHFELVDVVREWPGSTYEVYRRRADDRR